MTNDKTDLLLKVLAVSTEFVPFMDYNVSMKFDGDDLAVDLYDYQQMTSRMGIDFVFHITRIAHALDLMGFIYCSSGRPIIHLF